MPHTTTWVDTWLERGDWTVGRSQLRVSPTPTMHLRLKPDVPKRVEWVGKNLGGVHYFHYSEIVFLGCHSADGIGFRYYTRGGSPVSWKVTHDGYPHTAHEGETAVLRIRLLAARPGLRSTCILETRGGTGKDRVKLIVSS